MNEPEEELIGRWDATLAEAGPEASAELTFQPPGWGEDLSRGGGLPSLTLSGLPDSGLPDSGGPDSGGPAPGHRAESFDDIRVATESGSQLGSRSGASGEAGVGQGSGVYDKTVQLSEDSASGSGAFEATQAPPASSGDPSDSIHETLPGVPPGASRSADEVPLYTLEEVIGRGGMGVVYRAWQGSLQRSVALKRQLGVRSDAGRQRFVAEAVATGRLDHPNIVPVYDLGTDPTGDVVLTMKLVDGVPWKALLHPQSDSDRQRAEAYDREDHLRVLIQVCNATAFAHSRNIVHNDLKPENVMLGEFGEVLVMDWGLAVHIGDADEETSIPHRTALQAPCGTPAYMPPELADGAGERIGPWTDVYLLGAILHELITGHAPHTGSSLHKVIVAAARSEPPTFSSEVSSELADICRKAMSRETSARYPVVSELKDAIETYLTHRESHVAAAGAKALLEACDPAQLSHEELYTELGEAIARYGQALELWAENDEAAAGRRQARLRFAECALSNGDLGLGAAQLGYLATDDEVAAELRGRVARAREERAREEQLQGRLRLALLAAVALFVVGLVTGLALLQREAARTALRAAEARAAQAVAEQARTDAEAARHVAEGLAAGSLVGQGDALLTAGRPAEATRRFQEALRYFKRLGRSSVSAELGLLSARRESASPLIRHAAHQGSVTGLGFGPKGDAYSCGEDGRVFGVPPLGRPRQLAKGLGPLRALAVSPVGSWVVTGGLDGRLHLVFPDGRPPDLLAELPGQIEALDVSIKGDVLVVGATDPPLSAFELPSGRPVGSFPAREDVHLQPVTGVATSANYLWTGDSAGRLVRWNAIRGNFEGADVHWDFSRQWPRWLPNRPIRALRFSANQPQFAFGSGTQVQVWHYTKRLIDRQGREGGLNNFSEHFRLEGHHAPVSDLTYIQGTHRLVSGGQDGRLLAWDVQSKTLVAEKDVPAHPRPIAQAFANQPVLSLASSPDGALIAAGHDDGSITVWDLGLALDLRSGAERGRQPLRFVEPPEPPLALRKPGRRRVQPGVEPPPLRALALGPDGRLAASGAEDGTLTLYDAQGGRRLEHINWHSERILAIKLGTERMLSVCANGWVRSWTLDTLSTASQATVGSASAASISGDGQAVAMGRHEGGVEVFDARTSQLAWRAPGSATPKLLALSPRGDALIVAAKDDSLRFVTRAGTSVELECEHSPTALVLLPTVALVGDQRGVLTIYGVPSGRVQRRRRVHGSDVRVLQVRGDRVFSAGGDGSWQLHELGDLSPIRSFRPGVESLHTLSVDSTGRRVLVGGRNVELWDLGRVQEEDALTAGLDQARGAKREIALGRSLIHRGQLDRGLPRLAASRSSADSLKVALAAWELDRLEQAHRALSRVRSRKEGGTTPEPYLMRLREALARERNERCSLLGRVEGRARGVWASKDGERGISASDTGQIDLWDLHNERRLRRIHQYAVGLSRIAVDRAGELLAFGDRFGNIELWRINPPERVRRWEGAERGTVNGLCFGPQGKVLYSAGYTKVIHVWSTADKELIREVKTPQEFNAPNGLAVSADGAWLAAVDGRQQVLLWRTSDFKLKTWPYAEQRSGFRALTFTPQGLVGYRTRGKQWLTYSLEGKLLQQSQPGPGYEQGAAVDADQGLGVVVTSGRGEHPVTIWNLRTGEVIDAFPSLEGNLTACFGKDGSLLLGGTHGRITQWSPR